ncbi:MAG: hypothetical protein LBJ08_01465, partial [Bifidobacteriaceae bacterium]|nr:hypothetical protein [Bifidobacteriaceae bacterium]
TALAKGQSNVGWETPWGTMAFGHRDAVTVALRNGVTADRPGEIPIGTWSDPPLTPSTPGRAAWTGAEGASRWNAERLGVPPPKPAAPRTATATIVPTTRHPTTPMMPHRSCVALRRS